jgi:hypothetical protein
LRHHFAKKNHGNESKPTFVDRNFVTLERGREILLLCCQKFLGQSNCWVSNAWAREFGELMTPSTKLSKDEETIPDTLRTLRRIVSFEERSPWQS